MLSTKKILKNTREILIKITSYILAVFTQKQTLRRSEIVPEQITRGFFFFNRY